ncbi:hypothetical protein CK203_029913 [Vitis vinifera]|uniref:Uncharacterized protein n=1 Tax=Vitis vinifera TaxID=29760 RepID=A0A438IDA3_VITVI|nr:hypothetical protein CK203_029913 [Vitis vinifera]
MKAVMRCMVLGAVKNAKMIVSESVDVSQCSENCETLSAAFLAMKSTGGKLLVFQSGKLANFY